MLKIVSTIVLKMLTILSRIVDTCWKKCSTLVYTIIDNYRNSLKFKPLFLVCLQDIFQPFFQTCCYMFQQCLNLNCSNKCPKIPENCFNACIKLPNTVSKLLSGLSLTQNGFNHLPLFNTECYLFLMPWVDSLTSTGIPHLLFTHLLFPGKTALSLLFFFCSWLTNIYLRLPGSFARQLPATTHDGGKGIFGRAFPTTSAECCLVVKLPWFGVTFCLPHALSAVSRSNSNSRGVVYAHWVPCCVVTAHWFGMTFFATRAVLVGKASIAGRLL